MSRARAVSSPSLQARRSALTSGDCSICGLSLGSIGAILPRKGILRLYDSSASRFTHKQMKESLLSSATMLPSGKNNGNIDNHDKNRFMISAEGLDTRFRWRHETGSVWVPVNLL